MPESLPRERALKLMREMLLIRRFEERSAELYTEQKIRGFLHLYVGEEAVAVGAMNALSDDDDVVAAYREHGHAMLRGVSPASAMAEMFGKVTGCSRGRGGSMHLFHAKRRFYGGFAIVGGALPLAAGLALGAKMKGESRAVAIFFGDGATDEGEFHETLNLVSLWRLPVLFLCENNFYAMGTALARHRAETEIHRQAAAYRIPADVVDGMDVEAVHDATARAADAVRREMSPRFLEFRTYRFRAHSMYDPDRYRDKDEIARWKERDPIKLYRAKLAAGRLLDDSGFLALDGEVNEEVERAIAEADAAPLESVEDLAKDVLLREIR